VVGNRELIVPVEVINGSIEDDYNLEFTIKFGGETQTATNGIVTINDNPLPTKRTDLALSITDNPFTAHYPLEFRLNKEEKKIIYLRIFSRTLILSDESFSIYVQADKI
jgi:hypothetical protein